MALMLSANSGKPKSSCIWLLLRYQGGSLNKANALGLYHLQPSDVRAGSGPPGRARVIHHWADELLVEQDSVPDGEITLPVKEGTQQATL